MNMKNAPRGVINLAEKMAREQMPQNVYDGALHAALGDSTMFLASTVLFAQVGDPSGENGMSFYDCAKLMMQSGEEFKKAAQDIHDERAMAEAAAAEAAWVAENEAKQAADVPDAPAEDGEPQDASEEG